LKLIFAITGYQRAESVLGQLSGRGFPVTLVHEERALLGSGSGTLMIGVPDGAVNRVLGLLDEVCGAQASQADVLLPASDPTDLMVTAHAPIIEGGVSIFVVDVSRFERMA
jgi:uncharacterized protein YaaQ